MPVYCTLQMKLLSSSLVFQHILHKSNGISIRLTVRSSQVDIRYVVHPHQIQSENKPVLCAQLSSVRPFIRQRLLPPANELRGKIMFSQMSVRPPGEGGGRLGGGIPARWSMVFGPFPGGGVVPSPFWG